MDRQYDPEAGSPLCVLQFRWDDLLGLYLRDFASRLANALNISTKRLEMGLRLQRTVRLGAYAAAVAVAIGGLHVDLGNFASVPGPKGEKGDVVLVKTGEVLVKPMPVRIASVTIESAPINVQEAPINVQEAPINVQEAPITVQNASISVDRVPVTIEEVSTSVKIDAISAPGDNWFRTELAEEDVFWVLPTGDFVIDVVNIGAVGQLQPPAVDLVFTSDAFMLSKTGAGRSQIRIPGCYGSDRGDTCFVNSGNPGDDICTFTSITGALRCEYKPRDGGNCLEVRLRHSLSQPRQPNPRGAAALEVRWELQQCTP